MQNIAKKLQRNTIIYIKQPLSKSHRFATSFPLETRPHAYIMFTILMYVFGINGVLFHGGRGGGAMSHWSIPFFVDYIVKIVILIPKSQRLSNIQKLFCQILMFHYKAIKIEVKTEEIWLSPMTKTPTPTEKSKKQRDNTKTPPKTTITQRLWTELGRSVGVTTATQLVWLNRFTCAQPSHYQQQLCHQKYTHLKICK